MNYFVLILTYVQLKDNFIVLTFSCLSHCVIVRTRAKSSGQNTVCR